MTDEVKGSDSVSTKYFISKCANIPSLKRCIETEQLACKDRQTSPQPREVIREAFSSGCKILIIFSVNNCHGWHGYAEIVNVPEFVGSLYDRKNEGQGQQIELENSNNAFESSEWYYFPVKWMKQFLSDFGQQCLPFQETDTLTFEDGSPINKARNWQVVPVEVGAKMCEYIDAFHDKLCEKREQKLRQKELQTPTPFFRAPDDQSLIEENWKKINDKITKELGGILLSCPFGSQRYNLHTADSDMDMFIVYQADTKDLLGFNPPKQTVKSNDTNSCDYTIHEVYRYAELLLTGDPRCIETLFINDDNILRSSETFKQLRDNRQLFLTRDCLDKYLRDALGSRGIKQFKKWMDDNPEEQVMPYKICKLSYIIIRLLQNASNIVDGGPLVVYRPQDSDERKLLMDIRNGKMSVQETWLKMNRLQNHIDENKDSVANDNTKLKSFLESWLISLRYKNFRKENL